MHSMTGFGFAEEKDNNQTVSVTMRSVNHKKRDIRISGLEEDPDLEEAVRGRVKEEITRGHVEVMVEGAAQEKVTLQFFKERYVFYRDLIETLSGKAADVAWLLSRPGVIERSDGEYDLDRALLLYAVEAALEKLLTMRRKEGSFLKGDLTSKLQRLSGDVAFIDSKTAEERELRKEAFKERVEEFMDAYAMDPARFSTELALLYEKMDIEEEIKRLHSHISQFNVIMGRKGSIGKSLDFLLQEMFREANTIGNKSKNIDVLHRVVDLKTGIDQLREQVANIE